MAPLKPYRQKGAKWDDYVKDEKAKTASAKLRVAVATQAPLVNPDYEAARDYIQSGRPFLLFVDASDFGYSAVLCQAESVHGTPRPIAVLSKSFDQTQQRWRPMEREMHALYEGAVWSQKYVKSFKVFLFTDHRNNTFRSKIQPTRRVSKKLLKMCIEIEPLLIERVYLAGSENILGDATSRAPADREVARNLPIPLQPIRDTIHRLFWAPDELAGQTADRLKKLKIQNPGVLSYLPEKLLAEADLVNEARVEDELSAVPHAFGATESCQLLSEVRRNIIENASCRLDELGGELLPVTSHEAGGQAGWNRLMMPAVEFPPDHLPDELLGADKVTRVRDKRGDSWVAWFPKRLKGYVSGSVPGRKEPVQKDARSLWYSTRVYGVRRAEQLAKRHLRRAET